MLRMDPSSLRQAAARLREVNDDHAAWYESLLRSVFCDVPDALEASGPGAHRECTLGHWFYEQAPNALRDLPAFIALGKEHQRLHQIANKLLRAANAGAPVPRADFEELVATSARLRVQADYLRSSIDAAMVNRDALTGALARVGMLPELHELRDGVRRGSPPCSIVFMDVDNLKHVNDTLGHQVGDAVLCGAVRHLECQLRVQDRVFRYGGDEFLVALPNTELDVALAVINRVREALAAKLVIAGSARASLRVTASFGLALLDPQVEVAESIHRADQALLIAKTAGRNRVIKWDASIQTSTRWRRIDVDSVPGK